MKLHNYTFVCFFPSSLSFNGATQRLKKTTVLCCLPQKSAVVSVDRGTIIEVNVSELGLVTQTGKVIFAKYAQVTNNPDAWRKNINKQSPRICWSNVGQLVI